MKQEYHYLIASLPELLRADSESKHPYPSFFDFCAEELKPAHRDELGRCFIFNDVDNLLGCLHGDSSFIRPSYYNEETLLEGLKDTDLLFPFMADYLQSREESDENLKGMLTTPRDQLLLLLYEGLNEFARAFVKDYLLFECRCRNLCLALSHRVLGQSYTKELIPGDYFCEQLGTNTALDFGLAGEIGIFEPLLELFARATPIEIEKKIDEIRWTWLDETIDYHYFSKEAVFSYALKIHSIERWLALDPQEGKQKLDNLISQVKERL